MSNYISATSKLGIPELEYVHTHMSSFYLTFYQMAICGRNKQIVNIMIKFNVS